MLKDVRGCLLSKRHPGTSACWWLAIGVWKLVGGEWLVVVRVSPLHPPPRHHKAPQEKILDLHAEEMAQSQNNGRSCQRSGSSRNQ